MGLQELEQITRGDMGLLALCAKISGQYDGTFLYPDKFSGGLRVVLKNGAWFERFEFINKGAKGNPLPVIKIRERFLSNCLAHLSMLQSENL